MSACLKILPRTSQFQSKFLLCNTYVSMTSKANTGAYLKIQFKSHAILGAFHLV